MDLPFGSMLYSLLSALCDRWAYVHHFLHIIPQRYLILYSYIHQNPKINKESV